MEKQGPRTTRQAMGLMDFGQYELKMLQEVQTHGEVSKNSIVFFCFVPCLEARNQRITKHKPLMVFQGQKQQLGLHSWKLLIIASLGYKTSFNHRKFLAKRENKTKQCSKFKHKRKSYLGDHQVVKQYDIEKTEAPLSNTNTKTAPSCFSTPTTPISP